MVLTSSGQSGKHSAKLDRAQIPDFQQLDGREETKDNRSSGIKNYEVTPTPCLAIRPTHTATTG